jgi:hypothetical protein
VTVAAGFGHYDGRKESTTAGRKYGEGAGHRRA